MKDIIIRRIQLDVVLLQIQVQFVGSKHLCDLDKLIVVVVTVEERLFSEDLVLGFVDDLTAGVTVRSQMTPTIEANIQPRLHISRL